MSNQQPAYDQINNSEALLQHYNDLQASKVIQISINTDGKVAEEYDENPMFNSMVYDVELPYGTIREYSVNFIAETLFIQVDGDGYTLTLMEGIINYNNVGR